jgi:hypothetical protein
MSDIPVRKRPIFNVAVYRGRDWLSDHNPTEWHNDAFVETESGRATLYSAVKHEQCERAGWECDTDPVLARIEQVVQVTFGLTGIEIRGLASDREHVFMVEHWRLTTLCKGEYCEYCRSA